VYQEINLSIIRTKKSVQVYYEAGCRVGGIGSVAIQFNAGFTFFFGGHRLYSARVCGDFVRGTTGEFLNLLNLLKSVKREKTTVQL